tara:strand:- start:1404 stop:2294 length:891 start_codon:yes stop_codon:yes gene_type:complete
MSKTNGWLGKCDLCFERREPDKKLTIQYGSFNAPFKLIKTTNNSDGRCEVPLLHTAGGLVGGDELILNINLRPKSSGLVTTVAAQKVYGTVGRSTIHPEGSWAKQLCNFNLQKDGDLEWVPQELVIFKGGLFEQTMRVELESGASFLSTEIVRLGRTSAGEKLEDGCWRSKVEISRNSPNSKYWEFIDQLELSGEALTSNHGLNFNPVFGSLIWIAPENFSTKNIEALIEVSRSIKQDLSGEMVCTPLKRGISARYLGESTQAARFWFLRIWSNIREIRNLSFPGNIRVWPLQEHN